MDEKLQALADELFSRLNQHELSICTAESITAGYLCGTIAKASGISRHLKGGLVCYQDSIKTGLLKIPKNLVACRYAVNEDVAKAMAQNVADLFNADIGLSTTGFAQNCEDYLPEAYIGIFVRDKFSVVSHLDLKGAKTREEARWQVVHKALEVLLDELVLC